MSTAPLLSMGLMRVEEERRSRQSKSTVPSVKNGGKKCNYMEMLSSNGTGNLAKVSRHHEKEGTHMNKL